MTTRVLFVRHGQSVLNQSRQFQSEDTPLSEDGINQAELVTNRLVNQKIDYIYSSTNIRAKHTANIIQQRLKLPFKTNPLLIEWHKPPEIQGKSFDDPSAKSILDQINLHRDDPNYHYSTEESFNQVVARIDTMLSNLAKHHPHQTVLAVTHGHFLRMTLLRLILKDKLNPTIFWQAFPILHHTNTGISEFEFNPDSGWKLLSWNDTTHL
jgi:phosphoserine phosphatase